MNQKDLLKNLASNIKSSNRNKEEIVKSLVDANILIGDGNFSKQYKNLEKFNRKNIENFGNKLIDEISKFVPRKYLENTDPLL